MSYGTDVSIRLTSVNCTRLPSSVCSGIDFDRNRKVLAFKAFQAVGTTDAMSLNASSRSRAGLRVQTSTLTGPKTFNKTRTQALGTTDAMNRRANASTRAALRVRASTLTSPKTFNETKAKGVTSGSYTFWYDVAHNIGTSQANVTWDGITVQDCLSACDDDVYCAAVAMQLQALLFTNDRAEGNEQLTLCSLIFGNTTPTSVRTLTKADTGKLYLDAY